MLFIIRSIILTLLMLCICLFGSLFCLLTPRDPRHVRTFGRLFSRLAPLLGIQVITHVPNNAASLGRAVYIANHQNNYDMLTVSRMVQPRTVTVGKKNLIWIPIFGLFYWLTGNILLNRSKSTRAHSTLTQVATQLHRRDISVWMFPEGTRSRGRGLIPFKTGAFYTAISAGVPIVPICVSNLHHKIRLNRWNNGYVIIEMLEPIATRHYSKSQARELADHCYQLMHCKIEQLNAEADLHERASI